MSDYNRRKGKFREPVRGSLGGGKLKNLFNTTLVCIVAFASGIQCASKQSPTPAPKAEAPQEVKSESNAVSYYHFLLGELATLDEDSSRALSHFKYASQFDGQSQALLIKQAEQFLSLGDVDAAKKSLSKINTPDSAEFYMAKARIASLELNIDASKDALTKAANLYRKEDNSQKLREVILMKVALLSDARRYKEARDSLNEYLKSSPGDEIAYYFLGKILTVQSDIEGAIKAYEKAVDLRPSFSMATTELGSIYEVNGEVDRAIELYEESLQHSPRETKIREKLINLYILNEKFEKGLVHIQQLVQLSPSDQQNRLRAALIQFKLGKLEEAKLGFEELLKDEEIAHDRIHFYLGALFEQQENLEKASENFKQVSSTSQYYVESQLQLAHILNDRLGKSDRAIKALSDAIGVRPYSKDLYLALAGYHERVNQLAEAIRVLHQATETFSKDEKILFVLGTFLDRVGDQDASIEKMKKVLSIDPYHAHALNHIGYIYTQNGKNLDEAERMLKKAVQIEPKNAYIIDSLGWLYYQKGNYQKARSLLERAQKIQPDEPEILEHLADVYAKLGLHKLALRMYRKVASIHAKYKEGMESKSDEATKRAERIREKIASVQTEGESF